MRDTCGLAHLDLSLSIGPIGHHQDCSSLPRHSRLESGFYGERTAALHEHCGVVLFRDIGYLQDALLDVLNQSDELRVSRTEVFQHGLFH